MILEPPPAYVYPFPGKLFVHEFAVSEVDGKCREYGTIALSEIMACSIRLGDGACIVVLPKLGIGGVGPRTHDALRQHELAHCNGWKHER